MLTWLRTLAQNLRRRRNGQVLTHTTARGDRGENLAVEFLKSIGYRILKTNERNLGGEIDIIALDKKTVVFVEVKTWSRAGQGGPAEAVDKRKQARLTRAALVFLKSRRMLDHAARFDVIEVILDRKESPVKHYPHAFEATGNFQFFS